MYYDIYSCGMRPISSTANLQKKNKEILYMLLLLFLCGCPSSGCLICFFVLRTFSMVVAWRLLFFLDFVFCATHWPITTHPLPPPLKLGHTYYALIFASRNQNRKKKTQTWSTFTAHFPTPLPALFFWGVSSSRLFKQPLLLNFLFDF